MTQEIEGVSGWSLVAPLMGELPEEMVQTFQKCESPIEQLFAAALGVVIRTMDEHLRPKLETQVPIGRFRADIVLIGPNGAPRIVVECDGEQWHRDKAKDAKRTEIIEAQGYRVLRVSGSSVHHNPLALAKVVMRSAGLLPLTYADARTILENAGCRS